MKKESRESGKRRGRNRNLRQRAAALLCILAAVMYTGCGADGGVSVNTDKSSQNSAGAVYDMGGGMYDMEEGLEYEAADSAAAEEGASESAGVPEGRKLIQTVSLEVETKEFEQMMSSLETQVRDMGGYIESMETYNGSSYSNYAASRYANLTIRIPAAKLNSFLQNVSDISNVVRRHDNVEDVTLSYVDMESRRNTLRTEQERLLEFLERAETIEEIITLEERLSEVRYQLESMESKLRTMDNLIDYSTVELNVSEVRELTDMQEKEPGPGKRIAYGFMRSLRDIGDGVMELAIWFLTHIPYLVIWGIVIAVIAVCCKKARAKRIRKKEEKEREAEAGMQARRARMQEWEAGASPQNDGKEKE